eukprot:6212110-Pleurochrysis_carterae.AAC.1
MRGGVRGALLCVPVSRGWDRATAKRQLGRVASKSCTSPHSDFTNRSIAFLMFLQEGDVKAVSRLLADAAAQVGAFSFCPRFLAAA